ARPLPLRLPAEVEQRGASLLVVPLHWEASSAGAQVTVPSPLVAMRSVVGPQGQALSSCYNNLRRQWLTQSGPADVHLRFSVPPPLRSMRVEQATLRLDLNCPSRQLDVAGFNLDREPVLLGHYSGPVGRVTLRIRDDGVLRLDENGGLLLALYVDRQASPDNDTAWRIEDAQLELTGRMPDEPAP
ncbi:MAG: hypothetical protein J5I93_04020, partial [Pirellulaceae bacterium]|nr:hypothetical protein [Pirellulaceae bacterium]